MSRNSRSPEEIEADIYRSRTHMSDTMHELEARLSPRRVRESAYHYGRHNGVNEFFFNLGQEIKQHPLPFLVTGIGLCWLVMAQRKAKQHANGRHAADHGMTERHDQLIAAKEEAPQRMIATHLGTQQGRANLSQHRPDVVGEATHLGTGQGWSGHVRAS